MRWGRHSCLPRSEGPNAKVELRAAPEGRQECLPHHFQSRHSEGSQSTNFPLSRQSYFFPMLYKFPSVRINICPREIAGEAKQSSPSEFVANTSNSGPLFSTVGRSEWLYGIVGGADLTKTTAVMAELQGTSRTSFTRDVLTVNIGLRQKLTDSCILIASLGHEVRAPEGESLALIGYCGVQLLY